MIFVNNDGLSCELRSTGRLFGDQFEIVVTVSTEDINASYFRSA